MTSRAGGIQSCLWFLRMPQMLQNLQWIVKRRISNPAIEACLAAWHNARMQMDVVRNWLAAELAKKKVTQTALANRIGMKNADVSKFLSGKRKQISLEQIQAAAEFLQSEPPQDFIANKKLYVKKAPLRGTIAAGILRATEMSVPVSVGNIPYLPTEEFSDLEQYAYQLNDSHAEDYAPAQAYVIFVDFNEARSSPEQDDVVRIEETIISSGRLMTRKTIEGTLRRVDIVRGRVMLRKLSANPDIHDLPYDPSDDRIKIRDLALGYYVLAQKSRVKR